MEKSRKIHFIAVESSLMCNLAIALKGLGHQVTGSYEQLTLLTSTNHLKHNLVPKEAGWFPERITSDIEGVIIDSCVKSDNPELRKAQALNLPVHSIPDIILKQSLDKQRLVVIGNHGKTTITLLIVHVLNFHHRKFDFVLSAPVQGFDNQVKLSDAPLIIIEGQDIMASCLDSTPQFLRYQHHIGVISGVEWQESEAYPTREEYIKQFALFASSTPKGGVLVYVEFDPVIAILSSLNKPDVVLAPYKTHPSSVDGGKEMLLTPGKQQVPLKISGKHNLQNISAAQEALKRIGITAEMFYQAIPSFEGMRN